MDNDIFQLTNNTQQFNQPKKIIFFGSIVSQFQDEVNHNHNKQLN